MVKCLNLKKSLFKKRVYIIAEAGVNHNGSLKNAFKLIDVAARASQRC